MLLCRLMTLRIQVRLYVPLLLKFYSGFVSGENNSQSPKHDVIDIDGDDNSIDADPHKETVEDELSKLSNTHGYQVADESCLDCLRVNWHSPVYSFFKTKVEIGYKKG